MPPVHFVETMKYADDTQNHICNVYLMMFNGEIDHLKLKSSEVEMAEWWDIEKMERVLNMGKKEENWLFVTPDSLMCLQALMNSKIFKKIKK